jgi:protein disulfide-isomerase
MRFFQLRVALVLLVFVSCQQKTQKVQTTELPPVWLTDYEQAKAKARTEKKRLLIDFTGEGWCPPCVRMNKEVFQTKEFADYAGKNLILLKVVFEPFVENGLNGSPVNVKLGEKYEVQGFPTILILSPQGDVLGGTSYRPGGVVPFLEALQAIP